MPVLILDEEIIVGESGDNQCDGMVNFGLTTLDVWQRRIDGSPLTEEQKDQYMAWMSEKPFEFMNLAPISPIPDELKVAQDHGVLTVWGTELNHSIRGYEKVLRLGFEGIRAEIEDKLAKVKPDRPRGNDQESQPHRI